MTRPSPILALRTAIRARLVADAGLTALLGGQRVYDEPPRGTDPPYVVFGDASTQDWSATGVTGHSHALELVVWSAQGGDSEALGVAGALADLLADAPLALSGHRLVRLGIASQEVSRPDANDPSAALRRAIVRLSALTELA
jgi:hypothetical protein